jgi:hypothetical protein
LNFVSRPSAERVSQRIITTPEFLLPATHDALGPQVVIAPAKFAQLELERAAVVRAPDNTVLPKLIDDQMRMFL